MKSQLEKITIVKIALGKKKYNGLKRNLYYECSIRKKK